MEIEQMFTPQEVMEIAKISKSTFYRHVASGLIKTVKIGNQLRISEKNLKEYLKGE